MNKKKNLLSRFTEDVSYNYHLIKTEDPNGHLVYLIKNGSALNIEMLEFYPTGIAEELVNQCSVKIDKFAPAIFFTEETNTEKLKYELNDKLSENFEFSTFIDEIKDEYRILEVNDSLLYKKDPKAYQEAKQKEHAEHQKELVEDYLNQLKEQKDKRETAILEYNNDLIKLLKEYFQDIIEYEKRDFEFHVELNKILANLVDEESWIKIDEKPFLCRTEVISLETDRINVYLTDNNEHSYTATLKFDKTAIFTEDVIRINKSDLIPVCKPDYEVISKLYDVNLTNIPEWEYKNDTDKFEYIIDYLVPIFKVEKEKKQQEFLDKLKESENQKKLLKEIFKNDNNNNDDDDDNDDNFNNNNMKKNKKSKNPSDWYFDVFVPEDGPCDLEPSIIALSEDGEGLDDQLGSHNLPQPIIDALNRAGIFGDSEMMEAMWEVNDSETKTKEDIIESMKKEGFIYLKGIAG